MKKFIKLIVALLAFTSVISCKDKSNRQVQYMPDMYVAVPYEANGANGINGEMVDKKPVAGTIKRGGVPAFEYPNNNEGYEAAKANLKSPLPVNQANLDNGKKMFDIYCAICHGQKGDGNGVLPQRDKFNGVPNYKDREITEGSIYFVIMHGRNLMGSHASQLTPKERWQVVQYVEKLRSDLLK
ncbi:cytochrome c [Tenacibaculum sp. UWU-22]|uniref:c-type cytochrome n=1 Tax=Tenacibaculum sp. UWU-22 TaxID=3234187 RepID=UPI0034DB1215